VFAKMFISLLADGSSISMQPLYENPAFDSFPSSVAETKQKCKDETLEDWLELEKAWK
jgi:hypothetical protein